MLQALRIGPRYDGFLFLADSARNPPALAPHRHVELELNLVVRGQITYVVDGRRFTFPARTLLWLFPAQVHQLVARSADAQNYVAVFKPKMVARSCREAWHRELRRQHPPQDGVAHTELAPADFERLCREMAELAEDGLDPDVLNREAGFGIATNFRFSHGDPDLLNAGLHHLLLLGWRHQRGRAGGTRAVALHPAVRRALARLDETEGGAESGAALARSCGVSEDHLGRLFGRQVGVSLTHYRNSVRLGRFWRAYQGGEGATLTEAMFAAGFGSYAQFYKVYRRAYGVGPRASLARTPAGKRGGAGKSFGVARGTAADGMRA
jgi:AraC-like DNA-binding protein